MSNQNVEKNSPDWATVRLRYEQDDSSIRALAREFHTTDTAIHRRANEGGWKRKSHHAKVQQALQQSEKPRPWRFETRCNALTAALRANQARVETVEDSVCADAMLVVALLHLGASIDAIAAAVETRTEAEFAELFGPVCVKFLESRDQPAAARAKAAFRRIVRAEQRTAFA